MSRMAAVPPGQPMTGRVTRERGLPGFTVVEMLLALAIAVTIVAIAVPVTSGALDEIHTAMAARYLAGRIMDARLQAIRRSASVGFRFEPLDGDHGFTGYLDGNANGIRSADIASGVDREIVPRDRLRHHFPGIAFGLLANVPEVDGAVAAASNGDGVRIGTSRILALAPDGTATSGTLYVHGRRGQYAVRILGATGRMRVLAYDRGGRRWVPR